MRKYSRQVGRYCVLVFGESTLHTGFKTYNKFNAKISKNKGRKKLSDRITNI